MARASSQPPPLPPPRIDAWSFGHIVVDGRPYSSDLILLPDRVSPDWWREEGHSLSAADLREVFAARPEVLVVGTGASGVLRVPQATEDALRDAGILVRIERTSEACGLYNRLRTESRAAAALHLTC